MREGAKGECPWRVDGEGADGCGNIEVKIFWSLTCTGK
jgi:hypothetical protein